MSVVYLLSSLPALSLDSKPAMTVAEFLAACHGELSAKDADACEALVSNRPCEHAFVRAWHDKEAVLRNMAVRNRARKLGRDAGRWTRPTSDCDLMLERLTDAAFQLEDPALREKALDRARWSAIEELEGVDPISIKRVFGYAVKLALAWKWCELDEARGLAAFETLTDMPITL